MSLPLNVLLVTDSFPPVCGGSGWSTWELARGLQGRGHHVEVLKVEIGSPSGIVTGQHDTVPMTIFRRNAPNVPALRNVIKNEALWRDLATYLTKTWLPRQPVDIIHAQHVMTTVPSIRAGTRTGTPVVATVRDYWPVCYWSDLIYDPSQPRLCPDCSTRMMTECVKPRAGAAALAAWPLIPYMRANLRTKRRTLATASAIIAVSSAIARDLRMRAPEIARTPLYTIPNPVDMTALDRARAASSPIEGPYILYAGKLATNKGVLTLLPAVERAGLHLPIVIAGDGPLREAITAQARAKQLDVRLLGWQSRDEVWALMRHATVLAFPSYGPESLSRVLIEAAALGTPIAAMDTGGTRDILQHRRTGLLSSDVDGFAHDLAELVADERLRHALGHAAELDVHARFSAASVVERVEQVYRQLLAPEAA
jgi:glycosyltransferase involved in cell wall biosynthesis